MHLLNELLTRGNDYREYILVSNDGDSKGLSRHAPRFRKKTDFQIRPHIFSSSEAIAVLELFVCSLNCLPEFIVERCLHFYEEGLAESLLLIRPM